ncbi:condensation domain-containing protein, partial [Candidatus Bipolaricaulota bacterium]
MSDRDLRDEIARLTPEEPAVWERRLLEKLPQACNETRTPDREEDQSLFPLSFAQERMWFLEQLAPGTPLYNIPWAVRLVGRLDVDMLRESLDTLVGRHAILRTTYQATAGAPYQVACKSSSLPFSVVDLRGVTNREEKLQELLSEEARRPFDLTSDYMLRATVVQLSDLEHVLLLIAHHIAADGSSCRVLNRELGLLYEALRAGTEPDLPSLPIEYTDYASWQRDEARSDDMERELTYWRKKLEGLPPTLDLPTQSSQPIEEPFVGATVRLSIPGAIVARVRKLATELNATPFMILVAAVMVILHRYTGETDLSIGIPVEGRTRLETESLVGLFVNTLVLRCDLSGQPSFAEVAQRVREVCVEAYGHQEVPFERIVADLGAERIKDRPPLIQVMLAYQSFSSETLSLAGTNA